MHYNYLPHRMGNKYSDETRKVIMICSSKFFHQNVKLGEEEAFGVFPVIKYCENVYDQQYWEVVTKYSKKVKNQAFQKPMIRIVFSCLFCNLFDKKLSYQKLTLMSLESPAITFRFIIHFPNSTSSLPA